MNRREFISSGFSALGMGAIAAPIRSVLSPDGILYAPLQVPTASDYVQDGLVAMWDGIENLGYGETDIFSRTWYDVVNGIEMPLVDCADFLPEGGLRIAVPDGYDGQGWMRPYWSQVYQHLQTAFGGFPSGTHNYDCTTEWLMRADDTASKSNGWPVSFGTNTGGGGCRLLTSGLAQISYNAGPEYVDDHNIVVNPVIAQSLTFSGDFSADADLATFVGYTNGRKLFNRTKSYASGHYAYGRLHNRPLIANGQNDGLVLNGNGAYKPSVYVINRGVWYCIRVYNRVLNDNEVAHNHSIDKARFGI